MAELPEDLQTALAGRYTIEGELARGGMGVVYRAYDVRHARPVALKVLHPDLVGANATERFLREMRFLAQLQHPHILPLHDSGEANGLLYYVMPLVVGESLRARLDRERQLPLDDAIRITREIADALGHAHDHGVLHRDIKPENILLSGGHALLVDFGIGLLQRDEASRLTQTGLALGTAAYMSPEQAAGDAVVDSRSDVYSLACVAYEMLAGRPPFLGASMREVIARHIMDPVPPLRAARSSVPPGLERELLKGLAKAPADRFSSAPALAAGLEKAASAPSGSPWRISVMARPRPALAAAIVIALAVPSFVVARRFALPTNYDAQRILVAPWENQSGDSTVADLARQISSSLPSDIAREGVGVAVPATVARDLVKRAPDEPGSSTEWLARKAGAGLFVRGECSRSEEMASCHIDILRMPANVLRMALTVSGNLSDKAFRADLTERVLAALELQRLYGDRAIWLGERLPRSLAAVRAFEDGWNSDQWSRIAEAARLDTAWTDAAIWSTEDMADGVAERKLDEIAHRADLLTGERENLEVHIATRRGNSERAYELARRRFAVNPELWVDVATVFAVVTGRASAALTHSSYADTMLHSPGGKLLPYIFRGMALHQLGRYRDELELARRLARRFPADAIVARTHEAAALAALGRVDSVRQRLAEWEATPEAGPRGPLAGTRAFIAGQELIVHGHEREGRDVLAATLPLYRRLRNAEGFSTNEVWVLVWTGQLQEAERLARDALAATRTPHDSIEYLGALGSISAQMGRRDRAMHFDRLLGSGARRRELAAEATFQRAVIASRLGDREGSVRFLEQARASARNGASLAHHFPAHRWPDLVALRDYLPYERFLRSRD